MNALSILSLYLILGVLSFLFAVDALELKALRKKKGTPEAAAHMKYLLNEKNDARVRVAYLLLFMFLPAMLIAEFFYDWE